jgi:hypothetical protein
VVLHLKHLAKRDRINPLHKDEANPMQEPPQPTDPRVLTMYQMAHHDIWWAKTSLWRATNWAFVILAALVGVAKLFYTADQLAIEATWPLIAVAVLVGLAAGWYLARLHGDIVTSRSVVRNVESRTGVQDLRKAIRSETRSARRVRSDSKRGIEFVIAMMVAISTALLVVVLYLTGDSGTAASLASRVLLWSLVWLLMHLAPPTVEGENKKTSR